MWLCAWWDHAFEKSPGFFLVLLYWLLFPSQASALSPGDTIIPQRKGNEFKLSKGRFVAQGS